MWPGSGFFRMPSGSCRSPRDRPLARSACAGGRAAEKGEPRKHRDRTEKTNRRKPSQQLRSCQCRRRARTQPTARVTCIPPRCALEGRGKLALGSATRCPLNALPPARRLWGRWAQRLGPTQAGARAPATSRDAADADIILIDAEWRAGGARRTCAVSGPLDPKVEKNKCGQAGPTKVDKAASNAQH